MGYDNSCPCKKWQCLKWCQWKYESNFMKVSICFCTYGTMQHMHNISSRVLTFLAWSVIVESFSHFLSALTLKHAIVYYSSVCVSVVKPRKKAHTFCNIISKHSLTTTRCKEKPKKTRSSILFPVQQQHQQSPSYPSRFGAARWLMMITKQEERGVTSNNNHRHSSHY